MEYIVNGSQGSGTLTVINPTKVDYAPKDLQPVMDCNCVPGCPCDCDKVQNITTTTQKQSTPSQITISNKILIYGGLALLALLLIKR